ncbi:ornithine cyclodeaminase family protein [Legionella spiritensis]|uniref:ornithine cyclodeaminase family protein n=1 Tax=Legionella spiritensis TaxID=452 RepID=UPI000F7085D8|nr:ornithine cyclodeaminase family protein [Legionella spiritensis]VEG89696.1 ornithine cyclodeaminase [Legionella spiritensis]
MTFVILTQQEIRQCIGMAQAIEVMETTFRQLYTGRAVMPVRSSVSVASENAMMLTMPAYLEDQHALGLKVVSIFPGNSGREKPVINGAIVLLNSETGEAQAMMEAGFITALRTGAVSGLATKYLAREDAGCVAIIGSGIQAMTQLEAVAAVRPVKEVLIWSRNHQNAVAFAKKIDQRYNVTCPETIRSAVRNADIICTATASSEPFLNYEDIKPDVHINAIGSHTHTMREISNDVMAKATVVVDQVASAMAESGELFAAVNAQCLNPGDIIELGQVVTESNNSFQANMTLFKSVGLAIQDVGIAQYIYEQALQAGLGVTMTL